MDFLRNKPLIALVGAVALPMAALLYLASLPGGGRSSLALILVQVGLVIGSVVLFAIFLARVLEQVNAGRVRRWLSSDEGRAWLDGLSDPERAEFLARLDGVGRADGWGEGPAEPTASDAPDDPRRLG